MARAFVGTAVYHLARVLIFVLLLELPNIVFHILHALCQGVQVMSKGSFVIYVVPYMRVVQHMRRTARLPAEARLYKPQKKCTRLEPRALHEASDRWRGDCLQKNHPQIERGLYHACSHRTVVYLILSHQDIHIPFHSELHVCICGIWHARPTEDFSKTWFVLPLTWPVMVCNSWITIPWIPGWRSRRCKCQQPPQGPRNGDRPYDVWCTRSSW